MPGLPSVTVMQADEVSQPFHREGWVYEEKYDGWRMLAYKEGSAVRLVSRAGKDHSRRFADLAANGLEAWAQVLEASYEGLVGKDESSAYVGGRTLKWLKVKQPHYRDGERGLGARRQIVVNMPARYEEFTNCERSALQTVSRTLSQRLSVAVYERLYLTFSNEPRSKGL